MLPFFRFLALLVMLAMLLGLIVPDAWLDKTGYAGPRWCLVADGLLVLLLLRLLAVTLL